MADAPAKLAPQLVVVGLLAIVVLAAGCAQPSGTRDAGDVVALLRSPAPAVRYEAVVRLGMLPPSPARRDGLASAVRDDDEAVRLLAAIVVAGDGPGEHAGWLRTHAEARVPSARTSTPNPSPQDVLSPGEQGLSPLGGLVYLDPWFAGTLLPGALVAAQDGDRRVRALGQRALRRLQPHVLRDGSAADGRRGTW